MAVKPQTFTFDDGHGERTLVIPLNEPLWCGNPIPIVLDIEARTRTRLSNGGNPVWFIRLHLDFRDGADPHDHMTFAEYVSRRHLGRVDVELPKTVPTSKPARTVQPVHFEDFDGHQFERLVFAYHLRVEPATRFEWYGQVGADSGRDIWGWRQDGSTLCIQCVNRRSIRASKITGDLEKVLRGPNGKPDAFRVVCASNISASARDQVRRHAHSNGIQACELWSGTEFEERMRRDTESLLKRFVDGVEFPDYPADLQQFIAETTPQDRNAKGVTLINSTNSGIVANNVIVRGGSRPRTIVISGSIATDIAKYNYVEYLIERLTHFRERGKSFGQRRNGKVHSGVTRNILKKELGGLTKDLPADRFAQIVEVIKKKIDATALGRRNRSQGIASYHSFDEHPGNQK